MTTTITNTVVVTDSCLEWWLAGGISAANCLAAYQPKGAASYAASKVNLANPGTYNLSDGAAYPTWDAVNGWTFVDGNLQYLTVASAIFTAIPCSMVCRFNINHNSATYQLMSICDTTAAKWFALVCHTTNKVWANASNLGNVTTTSWAAGTWGTAGGSFINNSLRYSYLDGGGKSPINTDAGTPTGLDTTYIGVLSNSGVLENYLDGRIIACAFYDIALSDAQQLELHNAMAAL